jgi:hypothetical protein
MALAVSFLIIFIIHILVTIVGVTCLLTLLWLLSKVQANSFNRLLYYMSAFSLIPFIVLFNTDVYLSEPYSLEIFDFWLVTSSMFWAGWLASYTVSALISFMLVQLIVFNNIFDIDKHKYILIAIVLGPISICFTLILIGLFGKTRNMTLFFNAYNSLNYLIFIPMTFNIVSYIVCRHKVNNMTSNLLIKHESSAAIISLMSRYKYYPILQVIGRIFCEWWIIAFSSFTNLDDMYDATKSPYEYTVLILMYVTLLVEVIGFLVVFLKMNPKCMKILTDKLRITTPGVGDTSSATDTCTGTSKENDPVESPNQLDIESKDRASADYTVYQIDFVDNDLTSKNFNRDSGDETRNSESDSFRFPSTELTVIDRNKGSSFTSFAKRPSKERHNNINVNKLDDDECFQLVASNLKSGISSGK